MNPANAVLSEHGRIISTLETVRAIDEDPTPVDRMIYRKPAPSTSYFLYFAENPTDFTHLVQNKPQLATSFVFTVSTATP